LVRQLAAAEVGGDAEKLEFFEEKIRPLLAASCLDCHNGTESSESELALTSRAALLAGGSFGPAIVPGKPDASLLYQAVRLTHKELRMPPEGNKPLTADQVADIRRWIESGAVWPGDAVKPTVSPKKPAEVKTEHWAFLPRGNPQPPVVDSPEWSQTAIDRFLHAAHQKQSLQPVGLADRRTLLRRLTMDLIGLPPSEQEMDAFLASRAPDEGAFAGEVDRLLASRHYGERWGRHWLDVARYADTQGDVGDFPIPQAYLYRNWVIDALNRDLPYDQFLQAQIAGDLLAREETNPARVRELKIATGFIALSRRFGNEKEGSLHLTIEDTIDTIGRGVMGVTLKCARCHDHKFDPMLATDYYGMYGVFASTRYPWAGLSTQKAPSDLVSADNLPATQAAIDAYWLQMARYEYQLGNHFRPWLRPTLERFAEVSKRLLQKDADRNALEAEREKLLAAFDGKFRELMLHGLKWVESERTRLAKNPPVEMLFAVQEGDPHDVQLHRRGDPENLGPVVPRQFLRVVKESENIVPSSGSGRLELAQWLTSPDHPLTSRTLVNRLWRHHFGRGLVETVSNLGVQGTKPSHPELLDYLANQFIADGWSLKSMHRRMVLSRAYRLASRETGPNADRDPNNLYLWRQNRRRLDAESIRDALLAASGQLDRSPGGAHPFPAWHTQRYGLNSPFTDVYPTNRRSVYLMVSRLQKHPFLDLFNGPDTNQTTGQRDEASVPGQALYLLNSEFVAEQAGALAERILQSAPRTPERIDALYQRTLARAATAEEHARLARFLDQYRQLQSDRAGQTELAAWTAVSRAVLLSNESFFVD